jgi:hypothetical protein
MLRRKTIEAVVALFMLSLLSQPFYGQNGPNAQRMGRWTFLGEATVNGAEDHDRIPVGRSDGRFRAIQIQVDRAPIEFQRVVVHYANGQDETLEIRNRINAGGRTRAIDLQGGDRAITNVEFWYSKGRWSSRRMPRVRLYGR